MGSSVAVRDYYGAGVIVGAEGYTGDALTNPTNPLFWEIWMGRVDNQTNGAVIGTAYITIEYDVAFTEPKVLPAS